MAYPAQAEPDCLAANPSNVQACATPTTAAVQVDHEQVLQAAAQATGATYIPVVPWLCSTVCPAVIGRYDVYANTSALTNQYISYLEGPLAAALQPVMGIPAKAKPSQPHASS
jgi:hypothetical protein